MNELKTRQDVDRVLTYPLALIFKHSTRCYVSSRANALIESFLTDHPDLPVYRVAVVESRPVSLYVEERTGVKHESPQLILLNEGSVLWQRSHYDITHSLLESVAG